jgi:phosphomannomutase / phosphoglucomutase
MNQGIFREYDIRGIVKTDLTDEVVYNLGRAYGTWMGRRGHHTVAVGHDIRLSSPHFSKIYVDGILSTGLNVIAIGQCTTPALYFAILQLKTDGGVMITGSHNPIEFNGFKMCEGLASVYGELIQELKNIILQNHYDRKSSGKLTRADIMPEYIAMLKTKFKFAKKLKVVVDCGNGAASPFAADLWTDMGLEIIPLYCEADGHFPNHLPDPTVPKYMQDLMQLVVAEKADLGIGYDGDADRIGAVDNKGRLIFADTLLAIFSADVLSRRPNEPIIFDVKCSQLLPEMIEQRGGKPIMWKTGHSLLKAKMKEMHAPLAGEMSGHMFFADQYYGFDDGVYASGRLMQILSNTTKKFSQIIDEMPSFVSTPEIRVECSDESKFEVIKKLVDDFRNHYQIIDIDGARVLFGDGWGLVRASNTQPALVLRFEAKTQQKLNEIVAIFKDKLGKFPDVKFTDKDFQ